MQKVTLRALEDFSNFLFLIFDKVEGLPCQRELGARGYLPAVAARSRPASSTGLPSEVLRLSQSFWIDSAVYTGCLKLPINSLGFAWTGNAFVWVQIPKTCCNTPCTSCFNLPVLPVQTYSPNTSFPWLLKRKWRTTFLTCSAHLKQNCFYHDF